MYKEEKNLFEPEVNLFDGGSEDEFFLSQFKVLGRKYFPKNSELHSEPLLILKAGNRFFELTKNSPIDEILIRYDIAPFFWLYNSPVVKFIKNFYRLEQRAKVTNSNNSIINFIEYYEKWVKAKTLEDKKYFAGSAVSILEQRNFAKNYFLQLLYATIKIFDKSFFDPTAASELLNQVFENVSVMNIEAEVKNEVCYYVNIFNGFSQLALNAPEKANLYFAGALLHKKDGVNAKYYTALAEIKQLNHDAATKTYNDLYENDLNRLKYSIEQNNVHLFGLLCEYNIMQNFFAFDDFAKIVVEITQEINSRIGQAEVLIHFLKSKIIDYNHVDHMIPKEPEHSRAIQTVDLIVHKFSHSSNLAFLSSLPLLADKFLSTINDIISKIEGEYEKQVQEKLNAFSLLIAESEYAIQQHQHDLDSIKVNVKAKVEKMIADAKMNIDNLVAEYENRIKNLDLQSDLNPLVTFKNGMSYNFFIAVIVLLVVGFASYSNNSQITEISNFRSMISAVIFSGTKWGIISFIIGIIFSAMQAGSTVMDRNYKRQGLVRKLQSINDRRDVEISDIKKEGEELERKMIEKTKERIQYHETRIEQLIVEKEKEAVELRAKLREQMNEDTKELKKMLDN